jgi:hypothetical protein
VRRSQANSFSQGAVWKKLPLKVFKVFVDPMQNLQDLFVDCCFDGIEKGAVEVARGAARVGAVPFIDGFAPALRVGPPLFLVDELGRLEPEVSGKQVARLEHVAGSQVEKIHDHLVKLVDERVVALRRRRSAANHHRRSPK